MTEAASPKPILCAAIISSVSSGATVDRPWSHMIVRLMIETAYKVRPARPRLRPVRRPSRRAWTTARRLLTTASSESRRPEREPTNGPRPARRVAISFVSR